MKYKKGEEANYLNIDKLVEIFIYYRYGIEYY